MPDFTAHPHPVLTVRCPTCGKAPGLWCRRPSGYMASDLHAARRAEADRVFIEQHEVTSVKLVENLGVAWGPSVMRRRLLQ